MNDRMSEELVTIKVFSYDHETLLYEPQLQAAGIYYLLKDQNTVTVDPFLSNAIGGIKLQVRKEDAKRALAVVGEIEQNRQESALESEIIVDGKIYEKTLEECPKCGAEDIYVKRPSLLQSLFFSSKEHYCKACKHQWKQR